jgi:aminoglycoside phosphotransferase (APT) family kinase protein
MKPATGKIIECVRSVLTQHILPECTSQNAAATLAIVDMALRELSSRAGSRRQQLSDFYRRAEKLVELGRHLFDAANPVILLDWDATSITNAETREAWITWEDAQNACDRLQAELVRLMDGMMARLQVSDDKEWKNQAGAWVEDVIRQEVNLAIDVATPREVFSGDEAVLPDMKSSRLSAYFGSRLALKHPESLTIERLSGGFSRQTLLLRVADREEAEKSWVLRKESVAGLLDGVSLPLKNEHSLLKLAFNWKLPVPRPLWFEGDRAVIGGAFLAMERAGGVPVGSPMKATGITDSIVRQIARTLARLHTIQWQEHSAEVRTTLRHPPNGTLTMGRAFATTLARWKTFFERKRTTPSPAICAAFNWLETNIPGGQSEVSLVHGDVGFHNMLFEDGSLTALLDWEHTDLGDPARDLVQLRRQITDHVPWPQFMEWYRESGAVDVSDETMRYYEVYSATNSVITMMVALECQFESQMSPDIKYLELGLGYLPHFLERFGVDASPIWS